VHLLEQSAKFDPDLILNDGWSLKLFEEVQQDE